MSLPALPGFTVEQAVWARDQDAIAHLRRQVFIDEQQVPDVLEWEDRDPHCDWFLARDGEGGVVGIARLVPEGQTGLAAGLGVGILGRMAVLPAWRRRGVGSALLRAVVAQSRARRLRQVWLHAQTHAVPFYGRHGFAARGPVFAEAGIPHQEMVITLESA